jgi:hypothetical protein
MWNQSADNPWHYCPQEDTILHISDMGCFPYPRIPRMSGRLWFSRECYASDTRPGPCQLQAAT